MKTRKERWRALFLGGILPLVLFTWIENVWGTLWGLVAGMILGIGEIVWEWRSQGKVDSLTWGGNGMLLVLGGVSLFTQDGVWFKLQPALLEGGMAIVLWGSLLCKKSVLLSLMEKQQGHLNPRLKPILAHAFRGLTLRLGFFFLFHAGLATWAALFWSTAAWVILKGVGFTLSLIVYLVVESLFLRYRFASIP